MQLRKMRTGRSWALVCKDGIGNGDGEGYLAWRFLLRFENEFEIDGFVRDLVDGQEYTFGDLKPSPHQPLEGTWEAVKQDNRKAYICRVIVGKTEDLRAVAWGSPEDVQALLEAMYPSRRSKAA